MNSQSNESNNNSHHIWRNSAEFLSRRTFSLICLYVCLIFVGSFILSYSSPIKYYKDFKIKRQNISLNSSSISAKQPESSSLNTSSINANQSKPSSQLFIDRNISISRRDAELNATLITRAKTRENRYYFNDFQYFRMIRNEFPNTTSGLQLGCSTGSVPLVPTTLTPKDVLFIIMGSVKNIEKAKVLARTWLQWTNGSFFIFADAADPSIPLTTLPELQGKPTREDAQHRQLLGSQWIINNKSEMIKNVKWVMFADDDTWVNVPALLSYLQHFDYRLLLSIGYIWDNLWVGNWAYFSGGGGIVFSQPAFMSTMPYIYTKECPFKSWNDVTFMHCLKEKGVTKIHSDKFFYEKAHVVSGLSHPTAVTYVGRITFHYVNDAAIARSMTCDTAAYWQWPINGCNR